MRGSIAALAALTLCGTLACSVQAPTAPTAAMLTSAAAVSPSERRDPTDISGSWVTSAFLFFDWLPGTEPDPYSFDNAVHCESYAFIENEEWNSLLLEQHGTRIVGTSRPGMGISCWANTPDGVGVSWFVDIDDTFEGRVEGDQVRLSLNKNIDVRVKPDPGSDDRWIGTIRVRMDPRPYAEPYWIEQPFALSPTTDYPCWYVHLAPPYCIPFP